MFLENTLLALHNHNSSSNCLRRDKLNYLTFQLTVYNKNLTFFNSSNDFLGENKSIVFKSTDCIGDTFRSLEALNN